MDDETPGEARPAVSDEGIDWRALLVRYMAHVWYQEGSPRVPWRQCDGFSDDEVAVLERIKDEAEKVNVE